MSRSAATTKKLQVTMRVQKRNGSFEPVDVNKIVRAVARCSVGLTHIDPLKIATKTIGGLYDGATTKELDTLSIQTAAQLIAEETEYSKLAARLLATFINKEIANQDIHSFSQSIGAGLRAGLIADRTAAFVIGQLAQAQRRDRRTSATISSSTSACARFTTAISCAIRSRAK